MSLWKKKWLNNVKNEIVDGICYNSFLYITQLLKQENGTSLSLQSLIENIF